MNTTLVTASPAYEAPALRWTGETAQIDPIIWWVVFVGFLFSSTLAYSAYCIYAGGSPDVSFTWRGWKVACHR